MDGLIYKISNNMSKSKSQDTIPIRNKIIIKSLVLIMKLIKEVQLKFIYVNLEKMCLNVIGIRHSCVKNLYAKLASNKPL